MSKLDVVQSFIDISRDLTKPSELNCLLSSLTREMGFDHFALIHHVDLRPFEHELGHMASGQLIALSDYPEAWVAKYIIDDLVTQDPVLLASHQTNVGFAWNEIHHLITLTRQHRDLLEQCKQAGIGNGFTIPTNVPGETNGSCNFVVKTGRDLPTNELMMAQLIGSYAFQAGRSIVTHVSSQQHKAKTKLTPRQIDCITLIAKGKSDWEIAKILGIAESTVKDYVDDARLRFGVSKRVQLVLRVAYEGHLPLSELVR